MSFLTLLAPWAESAAAALVDAGGCLQLLSVPAVALSSVRLLATPFCSACACRHAIRPLPAVFEFVAITTIPPWRPLPGHRSHCPSCGPWPWAQLRCNRAAALKLLPLFPAWCLRYVSFAEILMRKSIAGFEAVSNGDIDAAFRWSTLCFFGGMAVIALLDRVGCCYFVLNAF